MIKSFDQYIIWQIVFWLNGFAFPVILARLNLSFLTYKARLIKNPFHRDFSGSGEVPSAVLNGDQLSVPWVPSFPWLWTTRRPPCSQLGFKELVVTESISHWKYMNSKLMLNGIFSGVNYMSTLTLAWGSFIICFPFMKAIIEEEKTLPCTFQFLNTQFTIFWDII